MATGSAAREFRLGQQVFGALAPISSNGAYAQYVAVPEDQLAPKPSCLTHEVGRCKLTLA